jgi:hypothetical protein
VAMGHVFPLPISFHRCSVTQKNEKKKKPLINFITVLHKKP